MTNTDLPNASRFAGLFALRVSENELTLPTRKALLSRANPPEDENAPLPFFTEAEAETLVALVAALVPRVLPHPSPRTLARVIAERLQKGEGNGWRYADLPSDGDAYTNILHDLDQPTLFTGLDAEAQKERIQTVIATHLLGDLAAEVAETFYAYPSALDTIGYDGYADGGDEKLPVVAPPQRELKTTYDVLVIGTGAGGAPIIARLAAAGLSVLALEAGPRYTPSRDFATDEREQTKLYWNSERLSAGDFPIPFGSNNSGTGFGGSTLHFTAYTPRPHADDFRFHSDFGVGADWAVDYETLAPYLGEVERFIGVSGPASYLWDAERSEPAYPLPPLPLNEAAKIMERGCAPLGIRTSPAPNAALSQRYSVPGVGERTSCINRGFCQAGCSVGAKGSVDVTYLRYAEAHGATILSDSFVTKLERDTTSGAITGVVFTRQGETAERRVLANTVFLCAGAIESARLLLLNDIGNESGQVGRNFIAHTGLQVWAKFTEETIPWWGIPGGLISEDTHRPQTATNGILGDLRADAQNFAGGYLLQSIGVMPVNYASQFARGDTKPRFGAEVEQMMAGYRNVAGINICGDGLPYAHNFMELSDELDERGLPKPRVFYSPGENEKQMHRHAEIVMRAVFEKGGAQPETVWTFERYAHTIGTCRMGNDARTSVVDAECRVWNVPNLYICDNSVFPSSLAVNPSLTQMALSLYVADRFLGKSR